MNKDFRTDGVSEKRFVIQFILLSILAGLISAGFTLITDLAHELNMRIFHLNPLYVFVFIPPMFALNSYLLRKYFPYSDGSGLPQGYAIDVFSEEQINNVYSIRTMIGKIILTFMSILSGASLGKEGPTIQICSSLYASIKGVSAARRRILIKIGAGAGVAAAFNAPIGGMIFAVEEYLKHIHARLVTYLVLGAGIAVYFANLITGNAPYLGFIAQKLLYFDYKTGILAVVLGIICGFAGGIFTRAVVFVTVDKTFAINRWRKKHHVLNAAFFGLIVATIGYLTLGWSFGNGASSIHNFLQQDVNGPWYFALGKFGGVLASVAAFVPGGYFSTSLSIGAGIGDLFHHLFPFGIPLVQFYLLGMVGFLAAITQSPITAVAMVVEISNSIDMSLPILISAFFGSYIAEYFGDSVYHQQVLNYIPKERYEETR